MAKGIELMMAWIILYDPYYIYGFMPETESTWSHLLVSNLFIIPTANRNMAVMEAGVSSNKGIHRAIHPGFYIAYIISFLIFLWFFIRYANVPTYAYWLVMVGVIIMGLGSLQREILMKKRLTAGGEEACVSTRRNWTILYSILHVIAIGLIITGFVLIMIESTIPWWIWTLLLVGFVLSALGSVTHTFSPNNKLWGTILHLSGLILGLVAFVFIIIYSNAPYWVWLLYALTVWLGVISSGAEFASRRNEVLVDCDVNCNDYLNNAPKKGKRVVDDDCDMCPSPCTKPKPKSKCSPCNKNVQFADTILTTADIDQPIFVVTPPAPTGVAIATLAVSEED